MTDLFKIDKALNLPVYRQIVNSVISRIEEGNLSVGSQIPSINQVSSDYRLARETVVKAFKILQSKGIITPVRGKGVLCFIGRLRYGEPDFCAVRYI